MSVVLLTKIYRFNAGHRLFNPDWDDERNWQTFGKCSYDEGHGHNYVLELTVRGIPDEDTGFVVPLAVLDEAVEAEVMDKLDHRNMNRRLKLDRAPVPTTEVLVLELWDALTAWIPPRVHLHRIKVSETAKNSFEYFGPDEMSD